MRSDAKLINYGISSISLCFFDVACVVSVFIITMLQESKQISIRKIRNLRDNRMKQERLSKPAIY